jgi:hypothetical protein
MYSRVSVVQCSYSIHFSTHYSILKHLMSAGARAYGPINVFFWHLYHDPEKAICPDKSWGLCAWPFHTGCHSLYAQMVQRQLSNAHALTWTLWWCAILAKFIMQSQGSTLSWWTSQVASALQLVELAQHHCVRHIYFRTAWCVATANIR